MATTKTKKKPTRSTTKKKRTTAAAPRARRSPAGKPGPVNEWLELRGSSIHGLGAFARKAIPKGTRIIEYTGEKISNAEADRRYDDEKMPDHHTFLFIINTKQCVDAAYNGNEARFINHSCDANAETFVIRGRIWIEALRDIKAGEEITYDYMYEDDPKYTEKDYRFYGCACGAKNCRGTIVKTKRWKP
jgi:SET domain-containing protein